MTRTFAPGIAVLTATASLLAQAQQGPAPENDLEEMTLEQLMEVPVEVGARHAESLAETAAAVFVLNEPEIRRSGMRTVPELLRLVPGLIVAQDVPGAYGFSSRLGEYEFAGMLVLLDGQRLYTTLLRREYWQAIDLPIECIERIEVVRGPGGSRWGDKASQGVINVVTKKAAAAKGLRLTATAGSEERYTGSFRFGESAGDATDFYVWGKIANRDGGYPTTAGDRWTNNRIGARVDTELAEGVDLTVDGEYHDSFLGDSYVIDPGFSSLNMIKGGHVKSRLRVKHDEDQWSELRLAADGYDQDIRDYRDDVPDEFLRWREELFDVTAQHSLRVAEGHQLTVGLGMRHLTVEWYRVFSDFGREYNEARGDLFAAWDWHLSDELRLTLGGNVGYQDGLRQSGVDVQPDVRLAWTPAPELTVWTAVSGNREPDTKVPDSGLLVRREASRLLAYELGVRRRFGDVLMITADGFVYEVENQLNGFDTEPVSGATLYVNEGETNAFGGELTVAWNPAADWRVTSFLATTQANSRHFDPSSFFTIEDEVPRLRGGMTLGYEPVPGLELDANVLYTEQHAGIPTWWRVDLRCGWRASENTSIEVVGQNLTDPHHPEYFYEEEIQRGFFFVVSHRF